MSTVLVLAALGLGLLIAYLDSRPNWDDTGVATLALAVRPRCRLWSRT
jgi:hypothetical protein